MIVILADDRNAAIGQKLYEALRAKNIEADYIPVQDAEVKPCYSCGGCTDKTYGKCIVRDDADVILPRVLKADKMVLVSPVVFGSYSFKLKRAYDKCAVIGDRHYKVVKNELIKGGLANLSYIYAVGVKNDCSAEEKAAFEALLKENNIITGSQGKAFIVEENVTNAVINKMVEEMCI